jgi:hypothetical protein
MRDKTVLHVVKWQTEDVYSYIIRVKLMKVNLRSCTTILSER